MITSSYGADPAQFGELHEPRGSRRAGTVVVIHGGFWRASYDLSLGRPLAQDLVRHGYAAWNIEYRRVGNGGGWPGTLLDVAAAIDHLATLDVDTSRVVAIGHSAGGHLAVWAAGRAELPDGAPGAAPVVRLSGAVAQAGVLDLESGVRERVGRGAIKALLAGTPGAVPQRYAVADPMRRVPLDVPVVCVHARQDEQVPFAQSASYVSAATAAGAQARLVEAAGDHFTLIDTDHADWSAARHAAMAMLSRR